MTTTVAAPPEQGTEPRHQPRTKPCRLCGHAYDQHDHYRVGLDCSAGHCYCPRYRRPDLLGRALDWLVERSTVPEAAYTDSPLGVIR
ncbi:hypothetical protein [Nakamurella leprariae]|uniref:Uncharacterized protein n=1 Tax=Nakamurella leprariae TaxID=2803911 RepID=A0A938YGA2_9ACTN|nr:hypothetical protein [Nakamurella leprariae]MBM9467283.1 hypothetical protein [Nakamurella leprariae]